MPFLGTSRQIARWTRRLWIHFGGRQDWATFGHNQVVDELYSRWPVFLAFMIGSFSDAVGFLRMGFLVNLVQTRNLADLRSGRR